MAKVLPLLHDHDIVVHRFTAPTQLEVEVYNATEVRRNEYFQGHYLKSVTATKTTETDTIPAGSYYISTAQSRANLISYLLEPETDDNLITWGWADHLLTVTGSAAATDDEAPPRPQQARTQRVPMMRVVKQQTMPLVEVVPFNEFSRNRYYRSY
jgi:hypothetical protein